jgi:hypothetical protein
MCEAVKWSKLRRQVNKNSNNILLKVKVNLSLCLINQASRHEDVWGSGSIAPPFSILALESVKWSASHEPYIMGVRHFPKRRTLTAYWN